ncbi:MAG: hypothetical protein ACP5J5_06165, partial [Dissulfurimicrobium sp.]
VVNTPIPRHNRLYLRLAGIVLAVLLIVGLVCVFRPPFGLAVPTFMVLIWLSVVIAGWLLIIKRASLETVLPSMTALILACGISGYELIFEPALSKAESGKSFVMDAERDLKRPMQIVLYGIKQDGDGVKYALFSKTLSKDILFIPKSVKDLKRYMLPTKFIMVGYKKDILELEERTRHTLAFTQTAIGHIHKKEVTAVTVRQL